MPSIPFSLRDRVWPVAGLLGLPVLLVLQILLGWPMHVSKELPEFAAGAVVKMRVPAGCPHSRWYHGQTGVWAEGKRLPQFRTQDALAEGGRDGFCVWDGNLFLYGRWQGRAGEFRTRGCQVVEPGGWAGP